MIRKIICRNCASGDRPYYVSGKDGYRDRCGWNQRHVFVALTSVRVCDECGSRVQGEIVHAVTLWQGPRYPEPAHWEDDYGQVMPDQAVRLHDSLVKNRGDE